MSDDATKDDPIVSQVRAYGSCDVADALLRLGHPHAGFLAGLTLRAPDSSATVAGRAFTVIWQSKTPVEAPKNYNGHYIDQVPPGHILFSSCPDISQAILGGLMGLRLAETGAAGAIINGRVRDLAELRATGLPVFSRDIGISAANTVVYPAQIDVPVTFSSAYGTVTIDPGDILVGDENGVAHIPRRFEKEVVNLIPRLLEQDAKVRAALKSGTSATEAFKLRTIK